MSKRRNSDTQAPQALCTTSDRHLFDKSSETAGAGLKHGVRQDSDRPLAPAQSQATGALPLQQESERLRAEKSEGEAWHYVHVCMYSCKLAASDLLSGTSVLVYESD